MRIHVLEREQVVARSRDDVFSFFAEPANLQALTPPWLHFEILAPAPIGMRAGALIAYRLRLHGLPLRWLTRIEAFEPPLGFVDVQLRGPYRVWHHTHTFEPAGGGTRVRDRVRYALPLPPLGDLAGAPLVRRDLERVFAFRRQAIAAALP